MKIGDMKIGGMKIGGMNPRLFDPMDTLTA
jgi:hypothetical protein